ncbi:MAG TPA: hypothetical protein VGP17_13625 [Solirubrobacteraceae bacterium]|jgi:hypothetical protein|nr:hypothetical protein [Solirubrobacteraceae bacterium]HTB50832.1 hypothetical protein [Solirubrobacteraceae bacterium]
MPDDIESATDLLLHDPHKLLLSALEDESHSPHYRLLIEYGVPFDPSPLIAGVTPGRKRCCALNSAELARQHPELYTYYEGVATHRTGPRWPISHAWCVDRHGHVVDRTWTFRTISPLAYRGVPMPLGVIGDWIVEESAGFLNTRDTFAMFGNDVECMARLLGLRRIDGAKPA